MDQLTIKNGYVPGSIGRIAEMHGRYYAKHWNFDIFFEAKVATGLAEFLQRYNREHDGFWTAAMQDRIEGSIERSRWESKEYTCWFRGSTLVDISPRDETLERDHRYIGDPTAQGTIPIYLRDHFKRDAAPMKTVTRFVSPRVLGW